MSKPSIIITLSGKKISMEYICENRAEVPIPFPRGNWPMPLSDFSRNMESRFGQDFIFEITKRLTTFFEETQADTGDLESQKTLLPIVFILENDVTDEDAESIRTDFSNLGYDNIATLRPDLLIAGYYRNGYHPQGVITVNSDGADLYISLSLDSQPGGVVRKVLYGDGYDPRTEALAMRIWEQVRERTIDLRIENEMPALTKVALDYLSSGRAEIEGTVRLSNGEECPFFIERDMVNNESTHRLQSTFAMFLKDFGLADRSRSVIVLRGDAITSNYLKQSLTPGFGEVAEMKENLRNAVIRLAVSNATGIEQKEIVEPKPEKARTPAFSPESNSSTVNTVFQPQEEPQQKESDKESSLIPIKIEATVETVSAGLLRRRRILKIHISGKRNEKLKWHSVLCVQEEPLTTVEMKNVVMDYARDSKLPFSLDVELPLKQCPNAKRLRIYFKPHPDEPVGINNAYKSALYNVEL